MGREQGVVYGSTGGDLLVRESQMHVESELVERVVTHDKDGNRICNSAGEPYPEECLIVDDVRWVVRED